MKARAKADKERLKLGPSRNKQVQKAIRLEGELENMRHFRPQQTLSGSSELASWQGDREWARLKAVEARGEANELDRRYQFYVQVGELIDQYLEESSRYESFTAALETSMTLPDPGGGVAAQQFMNARGKSLGELGRLRSELERRLPSILGEL
jgi:hypothetical protein